MKTRYRLLGGVMAASFAGAMLAPLAGYTDMGMRRVCRLYGAGMVFSEMLRERSNSRR